MNEVSDKRIIEGNILYDHSGITSINKQIKRKHKTAKNCDFILAEEFSENNSKVKYRKKQKIDDESHDLKNIYRDCSKFNRVHKHRKDKEHQDLNSPGEVIVFEDPEITLVNKESEKHKKTKGDCVLNITEEFPDTNSFTSRKKHKTNKESCSLKNIPDTSEFNHSHKNKNKEYHDEYDIINKESRVFDDSKVSSINKQTKIKHKKAKKSCKIVEFAAYNSETIPGEKHKMNEESHDLNNIHIGGSAEHNLTHKNKCKEYCDLGNTKESTVFEVSEVTSEVKQPKKRHKKVKTVCETVNFAENNSEIISGEKHKTNEKSYNLNNIDRSSPELNITHKNKKKHKKNKEYHDSGITKGSMDFDDSEITSTNKQTEKRHKNAKKSHVLNKNEKCADNNSEIISGKKLKMNKESCDFSSRELNVTHKKKHKEYHDLDITKEKTVFDDSEVTSVNKQTKEKHKKAKNKIKTVQFANTTSEKIAGEKHKINEESYNSNNIYFGSSELHVTHKNKKKPKKNKEYPDLNNTKESTIFDNSGVTSINKQKKKSHKKSKDSQNLNKTKKYADKNSEIVEKKHKKNKESNNSNKVEFVSPELNITEENEKKPKKNKEYTNLNNTKESNVFDNSQVTSINKQTNKKHKKSEDSQNLNKNEKCAVNNSEIFEKKHMDKESHNLNKVDFGNPELCVTYKKKHKGYYDLGITKNSTVFDDSEVTSIFKQTKKMHKKTKKSHDLNKTKKFADYNSEEISGKKRKRNKESHNLKNINFGSPECNRAYKNKKKRKKNKEYHDSEKITKESMDFNDSEKTARNKETEKNHKNTKKSHVLNKTEKFAENNSEKISRKKRKRNKESHNLKNINFGSPECNRAYKNKKKRKKNKEYHDSEKITKESMDFNDSEKTARNKETEKNHKNTKKSHVLNKTEKFAENNSEKISGKKRKRNKESHNLKNINFGSPECNLAYKNKKKRKKNKEYHDSEKNSKESMDFNDSETISGEKHEMNENLHNLNNFDLGSPDLHVTHKNKIKEYYKKHITERSSTCFYDSETTPIKKKKKHKKLKEGNVSVETVDHLGYFEIASTKKQRKKHKDGRNLRIVEIEESYNKDTDENHKRHQHCNYNKPLPNNMLKENNKDSNNSNETNECQSSVLNSKCAIIRDSEISIVSTPESDIELADNSDKDSVESRKCSSIEEQTPTPLDFTKELLEFEVPHLHKTETIQSVSKIQKQDFQSQGIDIKAGKFTSEEDAIIKQNFTNFTKKYGVSDPFILLGIGRHRRDKDTLKFTKAKHFYARLGKDLNNRTLKSIYHRAQKIIQEAN